MSVEAETEWTSDGWRGHNTDNTWHSWNSGWSSNGWSNRWSPWSWGSWSWWSSPRWSNWDRWDSWDSWRGWREEPRWSNWDWSDWRSCSSQAAQWRGSGEESQGQWPYRQIQDEEPESSKEPEAPSWHEEKEAWPCAKSSSQELAEDKSSWPNASSSTSAIPEVTRASYPEDPWKRYSQVHKDSHPELELQRPVRPVQAAAQVPAQTPSAQVPPAQARERSRPAVRPPRDLQSKIFVSGLSGDTLPQTLGEFCQSVGEVRYATVYMDPDSGSSNCTGKVDFDCRATAERAIQDLNGSTLDGAQITVQSLADVPLHFWQRRDTGCAVFIGNLDPSVTREELQAFASRIGEVVYVRIFVDRQTGQSRGCGKVEYASVELAEEAVLKLNGKALGGKELTVEPMSSERKPPVKVPKPQSTVFVGGLAPEMDEGALLELASRIGPVTFARIFRDRDSGRSRNCGKIEFETEDLAVQAVKQLAGVDFHGRKLSVQPFGQAPENSETRRPQVDGRQVFIAGLTPGTTSEMLREFCQIAVGNVDTSRVFLNRETGESKGTGKVEFQTAELAQKAIQELNGRLLDGHRLSARIMEQERPSRVVRETADPDCKLFIGNLPEEVSEEQLKDLLQQTGEVLSVSVFRSHGNCSGRAVMGSAEEASRAVSVLHDTFYVSNRIAVRLDAGKPQLDSTVFVGGLNFDTTSEGLHQHFAQVGDVVYASAFSVKGTGKSRGSGKVEFQTPEAARMAVQQLDGSELDGRQLHVKLMEAKPPLAPTRPPPGLRPPDSGRHLFVSLSTETSTEMLREFCECCLGDGAVAYCSVFTDKETGEPKGSAKLELASPELVDRAMKELEGAMLQGSRLSLRRPGEKPPQEPDGRTVFMGGLSWDLDSDGLKAFAQQVGEVCYAAVFTNRENGKSKGSGKVQFASSELALRAIDELNGRELLGREVSVRMMEAQPRKPG
ncbi:unnamed protein product [Cladocopium goreaui]|uniref:RRM domain-containing protein n=1 Tax=Cladocopium goreaui TaxID=2562237 RepID=A0A9P1FLM3_9DINO|nr:unnamed protein product [Cladocopium goreaui]